MEDKHKIRFVFDGHVIGKPRMTQQDKWLNPPRRPVAMWFAFADHFLLTALQAGFQRGGIIQEIHITAQLPGLKTDRPGEHHHSKPDVDNILKAALDALTDNDSTVWNAGIEKYVVNAGYERMIVELIFADPPTPRMALKQLRQAPYPPEYGLSAGNQES